MSPADDRCGDVAVTFGDRPPHRARLDAPWQARWAGPGGTLWTTPSGPGWAGYELAWQEADGGWTLTLGRRPDHWLEVAWDEATREWTVRTDRFGTLQAYAGDGVVATFSPATWADDPALDWTAVAGFFRLGWYPADRMPVAACRLLRPASEHRWSADGTALGATRWQDWTHDPGAGVDLADAVDRLDAVLGPVLDEQAATGPLAIPISGGLDSRLTVAVLTRPGGPADRDQLWAYSYGYEEGSPELRIAADVARLRGLPLERVVIPSHLVDDLDGVLAATEGLVELTLPRQAAVTDLLTAHADAVLAAHWGDVWFGAPTPTGAADGDALLAASTKRGHEWLLEHVVRPHAGREADLELRDLLAAEAAAVAHLDDPIVRLLALKTEQWSLRWTEPSLRAFQAAVAPRLPFYDPRVADVVLSLPSSLLTGRQVQIEHLRTRAPDLAKVEWQAREADLFQIRHERTWRLPRRALRRVGRRLRPSIAVLRNWEIQLLSPQGRAGVDRILLEAGAGIHDLVDPSVVADLLAAHRARPTDPSLGYAVASLLTFAAWRDAFT